MAKRKAPGKYYRKGLTLIEAVEMFGDPDFTRAVVHRAALA